MLFNSYVFLLVFLPITLITWWSVKSKPLRLVALCLASYVFYGWWDPRFVPLMIASSTADFYAGRAIYASTEVGAKRRILILLLAFNLGLLAVFKYLDFGIETYTTIVSWFGGHSTLSPLGIVLPIGISFYTFNSISYTIDIYRGRLKPARSILEFSAFVAMFPHLVAGPIVRFADMDEQFAQLPTRLTTESRTKGVWFFVTGMAKKILIADLIAAALADPLFADASHLGVGRAWLAVLGYTFQIYFDFSGYSDMAVGLAWMLGLRFPQNFDSPYQSANVSEFWRRWHMSLSTWLRDYLFIAMGGSRGTRAQTFRNLVITMGLGGLWHGASWNFVLWGLYHGALLVVHAAAAARGLVPRTRWVSVSITFLAVALGWVLFRAPTLGDAGAMYAGLFGLRGLDAWYDLRPLLISRDFVILAFAMGLAFGAKNLWHVALPRGRVYALALAAVLLVCMSRFWHASPFLYFQF